MRWDPTHPTASASKTPRRVERAATRGPWCAFALLALLAVTLLVGTRAVVPTPLAGQDAPQPLRVLAASSLVSALPDVVSAVLAPSDPTPRFSFDSSSRLARQIAEGAPADLYFSADRSWMDWLVERGRVRAESVRVVAGGRLVVVTPRSSTLTVARPEELASDPVRRIAVAGENVPAARYAEEALQAHGLWDRLSDRIVRGSSVRNTLEWVAREEVDAAIVYASDATSDARVRTVYTFSPDSHSPIVYLAAPTVDAESPDAALRFLDGIARPNVEERWTRAGFDRPDADAFAQEPSDVDRSVSTVDIGAAVLRTLWVGLLAVGLSLAPAIGIGWVLARKSFPGKVILSTLTHAPLVLPPVVTGFLMLALLGANGPLGGVLERMDLSIPFTLLGAVLAAGIVGLPLFIASARTAFEAVDHRYEEMAHTLGARPGRSFLRVTLPLAFPGIAAGAVLAFARALGEFGATIVLAGNVEGETRTISLAVYTLLESPGGWSGVWTLVVASIGLSLAAMAGYEGLNRWQKRRLEVDHG